MILGLSTNAFTLLHVVLSLIGIITGFVFLFSLIANKFLTHFAWIFLGSTTLTSLTGFAYPNTHITPGIFIGILSMVVLVPAFLALYAFHLTRGWRLTFIITAVLADYFNVFVLFVQLFKHVPFLIGLNAAQSKTATNIINPVVLLFFLWLILVIADKFKSHSI